jgi:DNA-binding transcriptional LysR family regulator
MDLRSLRYFVETVRHNSFTQAAEALHVTQSTISKMVRQLEDEVGEPLLVRDGRQLRLTDTGRVVFERGEEMLASLRQLDAELRDTKAAQRGRLAVGIPPMINLLFTPVLKAFRLRHPEIELLLREETGQEIERLVAAGELEIGLTVLPSDPQLALHSMPVASYPIWALAARGTFQPQRTTLKLKALAKLPLLLLRDDFALTRGLRGAFARAGFEPAVAAQSAQWDWLVAMASAGMGVALLPEPFTERLAIGPMDAVRLVEPELHWQVAHVWDGRYLSHAARAWLAVCDEVLKPAAARGSRSPR